MMKGLRVCTNRGKFSQNNLISNKGKKKKKRKEINGKQRTISRKILRFDFYDDRDELEFLRRIQIRKS